MKRMIWIIVLMLALTTLLVACGGGGGAAPAEQAAEAPAESAPAEDSIVEEPAAEQPAAEEPAAEEPAAEQPAAEEAATADMVAGRPASGIDPDTGLEINPAAITPGVDYIIRGELTSVNLTPQDSPEFMITSPAGVRYRIRTQPVPQILYDDGTQPALHEITRGTLAQATARQEEDAGATILVHSTDFTLLQATE